MKCTIYLFRSGSHIQRGGKNARVNTVNKILGGYKVDTFQTNNGHLIYKEFSQGPETLRPWFIVPSKETDEALDELCHMFESEILEAMENLTIKIGDKDYKVELEIKNLLFDTKLINYISGLHGAFCTMCTVSEKDGCDIDFIEEGELLFTFFSSTYF